MEQTKKSSLGKNQKINFPVIQQPKYFTGRDDLLNNLHQRLQKSETVLVNGLDGIGKSTLVKMYANRYQQDYKHIAYIFVQSSLMLDVVNFMQKYLQLKLAKNSLLERQFKQVISALQRIEGQNLLILDHVNNEKELIKLNKILQVSGWRVIIASNSESDKYATLTVNPLSETNAIELFKQHYPLKIEANKLTTLLATINYHTLLIELTAKIASEQKLNISQLLTILEQKADAQILQRIKISSQLNKQQSELYKYFLNLSSLNKLAKTEQINKPTKSILNRFKLNKLSETKSNNKLNEIEQQILRYFSILPTKYISLNDLKQLFIITEEQENKFENALNHLYQLGWLILQAESQTIAYKMHTLVQNVMFVKLQVSLAKCTNLIFMLSKLMQANLEANCRFHHCAQAVTQKLKHSNYNIIALNFYLSDFYKNSGHLDFALKSMYLVVQHTKQCGYKRYLIVSYKRIGNMYQTLGQIEPALKNFNICNQLCQDGHNSDKQDKWFKNELAMSYSKLGELYQKLGQMNKAIKFFESENHFIKEIYESNLKRDFVDERDTALEFYSKIGGIHKTMGRAEKARQSFEADNELFKKLCESNPENEDYKNGLAISYSKLGEAHQDLEETSKALEFFKLFTQLMQELNKLNPKSEEWKKGLAISYGKLGEIHRIMGNKAKMLKFFELFIKLMAGLRKSNTQNIQLKDNFAISCYIRGVNQDEQHTKDMYQQAISLWQELYKLTQLEIYQGYIAHAESSLPEPLE